MNNPGELVNFIWNVADLLRGPYKPHEYGRVILPMTVLAGSTASDLWTAAPIHFDG